MLVISAHLDDAVFSTGQLLAAHPGTVVVTVFAGIPDPATVDDYDRACGFANSQQAIRHRRKEDRIALDMLRAHAVHLNLQGVQYAAHTDREIASALNATLVEFQPDRVAGPVGLVHPDHQRVGEAWRHITRHAPDITRYAYEDLPYRDRFPRQSSAAINRFVRDNNATEATLPTGDVGDKARAMLAYASQLRLSAPLKCLERERLWRLPDLRGEVA